LFNEKKKVFALVESEIKKVLQLRHLAVVGLSKDPEKESHKVAAYLKHHGYDIVAVNPNCESVLDQICFQSLSRIPSEIAGRIQAIVVFRPAEESLEILLQALKLRTAYGNVKALWLQEGIKNAKTEKFAKKAGLWFVQNKCFRKEHQKMAKQH
jgi:predicted CoA-binding protein